jgi:predicted Zn-dependent protease
VSFSAPLALHESAMELVQANFHPAKTEQLYEKIKHIMKKTIEASVKDYRIPILESLGAFIVPGTF